MDLHRLIGAYFGNIGKQSFSEYFISATLLLMLRIYMLLKSNKNCFWTYRDLKFAFSMVFWSDRIDRVIGFAVDYLN
jgi:hypothetical protein